MIKAVVILLILIFLFFLPERTSDFERVVEREKNEAIDEGKIFEIESGEDSSTVQRVDEKSNTGTGGNSGSSKSGWWAYPDTIYETTKSGDDLLVLVNKQYKLSSTYSPNDLVKASNSGIRRGGSYSLRNIVIPDLTEMVNDAKANGIDLSIVSGYRSYQTQLSTYNYWLSKNNNNVEYVDTFSARAGHSQHQLGTVIDFSTNEINDALGDTFANTNASKWLIENAHKYGWVISYPKGYESTTGYKYESWHYRYIGKANALDMKNSGMILENYLRSKN